MEVEEGEKEDVVFVSRASNFRHMSSFFMPLLKHLLSLIKKMFVKLKFLNIFKNLPTSSATLSSDKVNQTVAVFSAAKLFVFKGVSPEERFTLEKK